VGQRSSPHAEAAGRRRDKTQGQLGNDRVILVILVVYVTMVYGPIAAFLVELVPDQDPLHVDVAALSHRQRLVRRDAAADRDGDGRGDGDYLLRALVSDRGGDHDPDIGSIF
jgi:hypothetical protein